MSDLNEEEAPQYEGYQIRRYEDGDQQFDDENIEYQQDIQGTAYFTQAPVSTIYQNQHESANDNSFNGRSSGEVQNVSSRHQENNSGGSEIFQSQRSEDAGNINNNLISSQNNQINNSSNQGQTLSLKNSKQSNKNTEQKNQGFQQPMMIQSQSLGSTEIRAAQNQSNQGSVQQNGQFNQVNQTTLIRSQPIDRPNSTTRQQTYGYQNVQVRQPEQQNQNINAQNRQISSNSSKIYALNSQISIPNTDQSGQYMQGSIIPSNPNPNRYFSNEQNQRYQYESSNLSRSFVNNNLPSTPSNQQQSIRSSINQNFLIQIPNRVLPNQPTASPTNQSYSIKPQSPSIPSFSNNQQPRNVHVIQQNQQAQHQVIQTGPQIQTYLERKPTTPIIVRQGPQIVVESSPVRRESPIQIRRQSSPPAQRQSIIFRNEVVDGRRASKSIGSQQKRPSVNFSYTDGAYRQLPHINPIALQNQVQVIREHTHTVIQKTTTIVWQTRYLTVIQKFNFVYERFNYLQQQLLLITQLLQKSRGKNNLQPVYQQLLMKHTLLLEMLSQTQIQLQMFKEENNNYKKQIQYEDQVRQLSASKQRYLQLQQQNGRLKSEVQRLTLQVGQLQKQNLSIQNTSNVNQYHIQNQNQLQSHLTDLQARFNAVQEQLQKTMTINTQLQAYIHNLENEGNNLAHQIDRFGNAERKNTQLTKILQDKQRIIAQLTNKISSFELNSKKSNQPQVKKYIQSIRALEEQIKLLEQKSTTYQESYVKQYVQKIQLQRVKLEELQNSYNKKLAQQNQRNLYLKSQQSIIGDLQRKLNEMKNRGSQQVNSGISLQRERQLMSIIEQLQSKQRNWTFETQKLNYEINTLRTQINGKNQEIISLREQKNSNQRAVQDKFNQRINQLQRQLRQNLQNKKQQSPQYNRPHVDNSREISELLQQNQRLSAQIRRRQQDWRKLEEQFINEQQNTRRKLMEKQSQLRLFNDKVMMIEQQSKRKVVEKERRIKSLQEQLEALNNKLKANIQTTPAKNTQSQQSFDNYSPGNNQQLRSLRQKYSLKEQQVSDLQRQKENIEKRLQALQSSFNSLDDQNSKKVQQLLSLKRQLSNTSTYQSEIKNLTDQVNKKNQQIIALKSSTFERNQLKAELQAIRNERNNLKNQIGSKTQEIDSLRVIISQLQGKIRQSKQKHALYPNTNQSAIQQLQVMYQNMKKKQSQIIKLKQSNQLLETNVQEIEYELERTKGKLVILEKNLAHEKDDSNNRAKQYENKIKQIELKYKLLEQSQRNVRSNFDAQLGNMDNLVKEREQSIRKLQGENKILKNKLKNHDSKVQEYDTLIETLNIKIRQLQSSRDEQKKHIQTLENGPNNNKRSYEQFQIKIVELEAAIKVKDNKIKQLENNLETLKIKATHSNQTEDDFINQQQIEVLRKKVAQYESRLYNQGGSKFSNYKLRDYESTQVFEQKALYDLKSQNERLRALLSGKGLKYEATTDHNSRGNFDFVQKRLLDFNHKLEELIEENRTLELKNTDFSMFLDNKRPSQELLSSFERERTAIFRRHRSQISALQARMVDLQRYCSSLQSFQNTSVYNSSTTKYTGGENVKNIYIEQLNYYKDKNKELEERIDSHLKLNKQLKDKLESMMKGVGDPNAVQFYKSQISQLQRQITDYLAKIKSLTDQNKTLNITISEIRNDNSSQIRVQELQNKIHELNRKIAQLQMQNGILENDLSKYIQDFKNAADQSHRHKTGGQQKDQKLATAEQSLRQANTKISNYEVQIVKLTNQIKLLESQMERLNEKIKLKQEQENAEITRLKNRLSQIQTDHRSLHEHSQSWNEAKNTYELTISTLNSRIVNLELEIEKLNNLYESLIKKARETENQLFTNENALKQQRNKNAELQALLRGKQSEAEDMNQFLQRLKRERETQGAQSKQRLAYISEMEQTIKSLRYEVSLSKNESQRLNSQINEYKQKLSAMRSMEEIIKQLRLQVQLSKTEIQRLNNQINQFKQRVSSNSQSTSQLEKVIDDLRNQISKYKGAIDILKEENRQLSQLSAGNAKLEALIENLRQEISRFKIQNEKYRSEIQRLKTEIQRYRIDKQNYQNQIDRMKKQKEQESGQFNQSQSYIFELQQTIRKLKLQIEGYKSENYKSSSEIERLRSEISRLELQINKLRIYIENIEKEMQLNQQIIDAIAYRLEYIRSVFIEVQVLQGQIQFDQSNHRQVDLREKLKKSTTNGLAVCGETFALL